jgi:hypothetical protein
MRGRDPLVDREKTNQFKGMDCRARPHDGDGDGSGEAGPM